MTKNAEDDDLVAVMVPTRLLPAVYRLLGTQMGVVEAQTATGGSESKEGFWTAARVKRAFEESPPSMKSFLKTLARRPEDGLTTDDFFEAVSEAVGREYGRQQIAGALGAFGRRVKNRYGADDWPFSAEWDYEIGQFVYTMSADTAEIIRSLEG